MYERLNTLRNISWGDSLGGREEDICPLWELHIVFLLVEAMPHLPKHSALLSPAYSKSLLKDKSHKWCFHQGLCMSGNKAKRSWPTSLAVMEDEQQLFAFQVVSAERALSCVLLHSSLEPPRLWIFPSLTPCPLINDVGFLPVNSLLVLKKKKRNKRQLSY